MTGPPTRRREVMVSAAAVALLGPTGCLAAAPETVSLLEFLPALHHTAIREGKSEFDCAPALQRALSETAAGGKTLLVPDGVYMLAPAHALAHADPHFECVAAVRLVSGMRIVGEKGATLRMTPGFSTDRRPRAMVMFGTDEGLADIAIAGLVLDMNGRRNPISPERRKGVYSHFPQAQIFVSNRSGRPTARIDRVRISETEFRDANGVSCLVMAQNDDRLARLGRSWTLERCTFKDNGLDTDDHSSVYALAEDVTALDCAFTNATPFETVGVNTAYEVHGSRQFISRCKFHNSLRGIWVANNYVDLTRDTLIEGNDFETLFYGVDFFHDRPEARAIVGTRIANNRFRFDDRRIESKPRLDFKAAVQIASEFAQQQVRVTGNSVVKVGHSVTSAFLVVTGGASGPLRHDQIVASDNKGSGLTFGSFLRTTRTKGLGRLTIVKNRWSGLEPSALMSIAAGVAVERTAVSQPVRFLALGGGSLTSSARAAGPVVGAFLNTTIENLQVEPLESPTGKRLEVEIGGGGHILARTGDIS